MQYRYDRLAAGRKDAARALRGVVARCCWVVEVTVANISWFNSQIRNTRA